jgi:signal transduction histidine kinase/CheY-like chemotaxis protein/HPt (histidine-containing phosphotransfer) domain-containing protein
MGSGAVIDLARSYVVLAGDFGKFSRVGMTIYCVVMVVDNVFKISKSYADSVKENAKLLENEVKTMEEQNWKLLIAKSEAEEARKEANAANVAKSNFLANMSHEIRTPINAVLGMDAMILRESNQNEIREYALDIQNAGQTLLSLVNDILDFSKVESGRMEILPAKYDISSIINDCYNMVAPAAKEKGVALKMENDHAMPYKLYGDEVRIRQIVLNILNNAVKYTHEGSVTLVLGYTPVDENNIIVKIKISDTGIGIAKDDINKIFDSFIRVEEGKNRNIQGTGLGLAITNQLVNLMGGHIEVESEYGSGTTFLVDIPQGVVDDKPIGDLSERFCKQEGRLKVYREKFRAPDAKILIVDDVPMNLKVMVSLLKRTRIAIDTAESGRECLEYITKKKYDIIFLDHMMPEMDGVEVLKRMKEMDGDTNKNKNTPVIMLTANAILGAEEEYVEMGFNDYMSKPVNEDKLENMIMKYLPDELILQEGGDEDFTEIDTQDTFLGKLSFLDTEKGLAYCGGSEDVYREILESYVDTTRDSDLQQFYETRDWDNYRIQVHALKSTSLTIGAEELSKLAKDMEMAAREKDYAFIDEHHDDMMGMFLELLSKLRHILGCSQ